MADLNFKNVQNFCARINLNTNTPTIDLSRITWFEPYALIYLGMFLRHHNRQGRYFEVISPKKNWTRNYLTQQNFWARFKFTPDPIADRGLLQFFSNTSFNDIVDLEERSDQVDEIAYALMDILQKRKVRVHTENVSTAVAELVDNFSQHACSSLAALMVQYYSGKEELRIAIGDCGIGIKQSLFECGRYNQIASMTHREAIEMALIDKVTRKHEGGIGLGLVRDIVLDSGGEMFLSSNDGCIFVDRHGRINSMNAPYSLSGVQVELCFPER